ncbi:MAG: SpoIIE family protein phosphatase [Vicingaceae bacterium]|nr:SpoIIE family protein phosphatase [Vicingaceae bacterium]
MNTNSVNWQSEINKTILRYHTIALWVAVIFNMLFFVTDYFNIYEYWQEFLTFRVAVSFVCLVTVLFHEKIKIPIEVLGFVPVFLISIQNAYMWSVMDLEHLQKHAFAYIALFIGSGMFMFYHVYYSILIVVANIIANIIFFYYNSTLSLDEILVSGGLLTGAVAVFSILLIRMRYRLTKKEIVARLMLEKSKKQLEEQKAITEEKNKEIVDSINYAKRIQDALITPPSKLKKLLPESFVVFMPKDIVSGDFYWATEITTTKPNQPNEKLVVFAVADCTGHGVSGAFMSIIGLKILNQSKIQPNINSPAEALNYLNDEVYSTINIHTDDENVIRDGMDIALCSLQLSESSARLQYAGANNSLYIIRNGELLETKADKQPIGAYETEKSFQNHEIELQKGDMVYLFSDGYADQFGGPKGKKFNYRQFKELLTEVSSLPVDEQKETLIDAHNAWKGSQEQLDDICIMGVRV